MNELTLQQIRTSFEELEKRIKAMERSVGVNSQITALVSYMQEVKSLIEQFEDNYNEHLTDYQTHTQDYNSFKESIQTSLNLNNTTDNNQSLLINNLSTQLTQLSTTINTLKTKVEELEENTGEGNQTSDYAKVLFNLTATHTTEKSPRFYILNANKGLTKINVYFYGTYTTNTQKTSITVNLYLNDTKIKTKELAIEHGKDFECSFAYNFLSANTSDYIQLELTNVYGTAFNYMEVYLSGTDTSLLSYPDRKVNFFCFNNQYYVVDNSVKDKIKYAVVDKTNLANLDTSYEITDKTLEVSYEIRLINCCVPATKLNETNTLEIDTTNADRGLTFLSMRLTQDSANYVYQYSISQKKLTAKFGQTDPCGVGDLLPYADNSAGLCLANASFKYNNVINLTVLNNSIVENIELKFNNVKLKNCFANKLVRNNRVRVGDSVCSLSGNIVTDINGNVTYYPSKNSTYKIDIAKGRNASAYLQSNGNINVYINRFCNVYKYVLQKNTTTNQYELQGLAKVFQGITGYEELYDNKAVVYMFDEHKIVTNQEF